MIQMRKDLAINKTQR